MGVFLTLDSHPVKHFIAQEMHVFSHPFPTTQEKTAKAIEWGKSRKLVPSNILQYPSNVENLGEIGTHTFPIVWVLFPLVTWEVNVFSHQFPITWEKAAKPTELGKPGKLVPGNILQNPSYVENLGEIGTHTFPLVWVLFRLDFRPMVYFITWEVHGFSHQISHSIRKVSKTHRMAKAWEIGSHDFSIKCVLFSHQIPIL